MLYAVALRQIAIRQQQSHRKRSHADDDWEHVFEIIECSRNGHNKFEQAIVSYSSFNFDYCDEFEEETFI